MAFLSFFLEFYLDPNNFLTVKATTYAWAVWNIWMFQLSRNVCIFVAASAYPKLWAF